MKVESSNLELIGFDDGKTFIKFKNGKLYEYPNTTLEEFNSLVNADSIGKQFFKSYKGKEEFTLLENAILEKKQLPLLDRVNEHILHYKGNEAAVQVFKLFKAELIKNSKAKKPLSDDEVSEKYFSALKNEKEQYERANKDLSRVNYEILLIKKLIPVQPTELTEAEVKKAVNTYIGVKGFTMKDMGAIIRVMKTALGSHNGRLISKIVKESLS